MNGLALAQGLAQSLRGYWRRSLTEPLWGRSSILVLHRILANEEAARLPHRAPWCLGPESFERLLLTLSDIAGFVSLPTALCVHHDPQARIALTFDSAWKDTAEVAAPLLEHYAIPASIFVSTGWLGRPGGTWREIVGEGLWQRQSPQLIRTVLGDAGLPLPPMPPPHPGNAYSHALLDYFHVLKNYDSCRLNSVAAQLQADLGNPLQGLDPFSVRRLESSGLFRFGARGVDLGDFDAQSDDQVRWQVRRSRRELAQLCRDPLTIFAYPDSRPSIRIQQLVNRCGVQTALMSSGGWLQHRHNPLALPRIPVNQPIAQSPGRLYDYLLGQL